VANWKCNDGAYPSRYGYYDGITQNPFEVVYVKSTWYAGEPFSSTYARWYMEHADNRTGAEGTHNTTLFHQSMSTLARMPRDFSSCYRPTPPQR